MEIHVIDTGFFKLDGGAMFGVVPKSIWNKLNPADENNMCTWAMRCLLIIKGNKKILIDTGIGDKQAPAFFSHFYLHGDSSLLKSLQKIGISPDQITDVFLTHLHFDHCGGAVKYKDDKTSLHPVFQNANYWTDEDHFNWAINPNPREKASFLKENILPLQENQVLKFVKNRESPFQQIEILYVNGHTENQMLPLISIKGKKVLFCADLFPSVAHIPLPYIMAYDMRPLETLKEKEIILKRAFNENWILFFEHDPLNECCTLQETEKGIRPKEILKLENIFA